MPLQMHGHIDDPILFGLRLRERRVTIGLTQSQLAAGACTIGYISRLEGGMRYPSLQLVRDFARKLGVTEAWLAGEATSSEPCSLCHDVGWILDGDKKDPALLELIPCLIPDCPSSGRYVEHVTLEPLGLTRPVVSPAGHVMAVGR